MKLTMSKLCVRILFVVGISAMTIAKPSRDIIQNHVGNLPFLNHMQRTTQFLCKHPQLRSIPVKDLVMFPPNRDEQFTPSSTVLARCDEHAGCCQDGKICAPADMQQVELVFVVNHLIDRERPRHHEVIKAYNHTRCHCVLDSI